MIYIIFKYLSIHVKYCPGRYISYISDTNGWAMRPENDIAMFYNVSTISLFIMVCLYNDMIYNLQRQGNVQHMQTRARGRSRARAQAQYA